MQCCSQCAGIEREFNSRVAARELSRYRRRGATGTTRILLDALHVVEVEGQTLLDIGGGAGAIQHELARAGIARIMSVDASPSYLDAQRTEAERLGYAGRASYLSGDFVTLAVDVADSDIVTLDRVICCYPDMNSLVGLSASRTRRLYGVVYPRGTWWNAVSFVVMNLVMRLRRSPFRGYLHPPAKVDALIRDHGLQLRFLRETFLWTVAVYTRQGETFAV